MDFELGAPASVNYEQKYKDALERAREWYNNPNSSNIGKSYLYNVFPELKNEDERIRKELIKVFSNREKYLIDQSFGDITVSEVLAWLEKKCEHKHKFNIGDIISNGQVVYRVDNITKNYIGQDCYFLVNVELEKKSLRYLSLCSREETSYMGEITWLCEQVDRQFRIKED